MTAMHHDTFSERLSRIARLTRKELSEILRDRRTILTLILMPLLLYPLLSVAFKQFFLASGLDANQQPEYKVAFLSAEEGNHFYKFLMNGDDLLRQNSPPSGKPAKMPKIIPLALDEPSRQRLEENVISGTAHIAVVVKNQMQVGRDAAIDYEAIFLADSPVSREVLEYVERRISAMNLNFLESRLGKAGPAVARLRVHRSPLTRPDGGEIISLSALVPLILILMTITGAVYPAIDLTAGERERGTLEILVAAPVPRMGLLFAKYVSVVTVAVLTALVNLVMMMVTLSISGLGGLIFSDGLTVLLVLQLFGLLLLFATFFSAVLLTISSFARSFKEAQAYLIPLMLVSLAPGVAGMIPGLKLNTFFSVVPLVNIVLLARDLFENSANLGLALVVVISTLLYAAAALSIAARIFGSEGVLYNEQSGWGDIFRRPRETAEQPTLAAALLCYALMFPSLFLFQGALRFFDPQTQMMGRVIGTAIVFVGFPLVAALTRNVRIRTGFRFRGFSAWSLIGAAIIGPALFMPAFELLAGLREAGFSLLRGHEDTIREELERWRQLSPAVLAGSMVAIGIMEEWFFRGFLFSALRSVLSPAATIALSSVLFGFAHMELGPDRLVISTLLGLVLGLVAHYSGSVVPGMIVHGAYNALWGLLAYFQADNLRPEILWPASAAGIVVGSVLMFLSRRKGATP